MATIVLYVPLFDVVGALYRLDCTENGDMCQNLRAAALLMFLPFVEAGTVLHQYITIAVALKSMCAFVPTVQMFLFLALARGWGTTRAYLPPDTWRLHLCLSFTFYVCLTVFSR